MNFFKKFYLPSSKPLSENGSGGDCENGEVGEEEIDSNRDICSPFKRTFLSPTLFVDSSAANDYVCKICHFMAVDPLEHVPGPNVTCSNIFCLPCVKTYSTFSCPAEGCLTSGFDWSSLRELGTREIARLSNLMLNCEFKCSQVIPYRDYWTHREKCPANPDNFCEICDSPKTCDTHSCREVFIQLKKKDETLVKENNQLKAEIDRLRRELDSLRGERAEKMSNGISSTQITHEKWAKRVSSLKKEIHSLRTTSGSPKQAKYQNDFDFSKPPDRFRLRHQLASSSERSKITLRSSQSLSDQLNNLRPKQSHCNNIIKPLWAFNQNKFPNKQK